MRYDQVDFMDASQYAQAGSLDAIHLDEENHAKLAQAIYEKIQRVRK